MPTRRRAALILASAILFAAAYTGIPRLIEAVAYMPEAARVRAVRTLSAGVAPRAQQVRIASEAEQLHGWWIPAERGWGCVRGTVLLFHGNKGGIAGWDAIGRAFVERGFNVLLIDYRGYGQSTGVPSEAGLAKDAQAAYAYLRNVRKVEPHELIVFGHSLGAAVAARLAGSAQVGGLVLVSGYASLPSAMRGRLGNWVPAGWALSRVGAFETARFLTSASVPVLLVSGAKDILLSANQLDTLAAAAPPRSRRMLVPDVGHNAVLGAPQLWSEVDRYLAERGSCRAKVTGAGSVS